MSSSLWYNMREVLVMKSKEALSDERDALVVKSNILLREARYNLTANQQKLLIYLISKVEAEDKDFKTVELSVIDYCHLTNTGVGSNIYNEIKKDLKRLSDKSVWINNEDGSETLFRWIDTTTLKKGENGLIKKGKIDVILSESLRPYLIGLKKNFTKYRLFQILVLKSKHSIRLYELLKSYLYLGKWKVSVKLLKEILDIQDKYPKYQDFNKRVLKQAIEEINNITDLWIEYEPIRTGRFITDIEFKIKEKEGEQLCFDTWLKQCERLLD